MLRIAENQFLIFKSHLNTLELWVILLFSKLPIIFQIKQKNTV